MNSSSSLRPPTRLPPNPTMAATTTTTANRGVVPPKIPPRPNLSSSPSRTVKTATSALIGGLMRRFPSANSESPPSASLNKKSVVVGLSKFNEQFDAELAPSIMVLTSPKNRLLAAASTRTNQAKVHSVTTPQPEEKLEEKFEQLCNVSRESEALAKGRGVVRKQYRLQDFELGVTLGTGSFGRVKHAKFKSPLPNETKSGIAIKILNKDLVKRQNQVDHIKHEKQILAALSSSRAAKGSGEDDDDDEDEFDLEINGDDFDFDEEREPWIPEPGQAHPFIVKMFGTFQTSTYLFMVLEFVPGGEFFTHLRMKGHFKNHEAMFYASSVASVFAFLHLKQVAYRDLKPENLLLDHQGYIKVVDFGFAKRVPDNRTFTLCGTPDYIAPEVLMNAGHGKGVDWWALGVLTYEMLSGVSPFSDVDTLTIYKKICKGLQAYPSYFEADARSFIRRLLQVDVKKRYGCLANGAEDVLLHRWLLPVDHELLLARKLEAPFVPPTKGPDDTSCFEDYPHNPEDDFLGEHRDEDEGEFRGFSTVC